MARFDRYFYFWNGGGAVVLTSGAAGWKLHARKSSFLMSEKERKYRLDKFSQTGNNHRQPFYNRNSEKCLNCEANNDYCPDFSPLVKL